MPLAIALALALLVGGEEALAQEDDDVPRAEDIVVRARTQAPAEVFQDTPVETEVITREEVQTIPARDAADIVARLPGIRAQQRAQGQDAAVSIEGMPPEYTLLLVDGRIYSGEIGGVGDLADIPLANVDRIEILRGAQALRYGSSGSGGVINIITRRPPDDGVRADADAGAGDDGFVKILASAGYGNETLGGSLSYYEEQIDGFDAEGGGVLIGAGADSDEVERSGDASFRYQVTNTIESRSWAGFRKEHEAQRFDTGTGFVDEKRWRGYQQLEWLGDESRLEGSLFYYRNELETTVGREFELQEDQARASAVFDHFFETGPVSHAIAIGVDGRNERIRLDEKTIPELRTERIQRGAVYGIVESELTRWLTLEAGIRGEFHSEFDPEAVPQVALLVTPLDSLKLRASWGMGHRAPSLRDLYQPVVSQQNSTYFLAGDEDLDPESSTSLRAGFEWTPDRRISLAATFFYNAIDDHIRSVNTGETVLIGVTEFREFPPGVTRPPPDLICQVAALPECGTTVIQEDRRPLFRKTNLDSVRTRGLEGRLELRPHPLVLGQLGYTFLQTSVRDDERPEIDELPNESRHTIDALLTVQAPPWWRSYFDGRFDTRLTLRGRWRSGAEVTDNIGIGTTTGADPEDAPSSFVLDARLEQPLPLPGRITVYADLFNLTDESQVDSYAVRGRTFFVGIRGEIPWW